MAKNFVGIALLRHLYPYKRDAITASSDYHGNYNANRRLRFFADDAA